MAKGREGSNKKDREKAMAQKRKEKDKRKEERKASSTKGKGLDDMIAWVDAYGNIVSAPPDPAEREEVNLEDIRISVAKKEDIEEVDLTRTGTITFFNDTKGFGFIRDDKNGESIFVHRTDLDRPVIETDKVSFETVRGPKGLNAVNVKHV